MNKIISNNKRFGFKNDEKSIMCSQTFSNYNFKKKSRLTKKVDENLFEKY